MNGINCNSKAIEDFKEALATIRILMHKLITHFVNCDGTELDNKIILQAIDNVDHRAVHEINKNIVVMLNSNDHYDLKFISNDLITNLKKSRAELIISFYELATAANNWDKESFLQIATQIIYKIDDFIVGL